MAERVKANPPHALLSAAGVWHPLGDLCCMGRYSGEYGEDMARSEWKDVVAEIVDRHLDQVIVCVAATRTEVDLIRWQGPPGAAGMHVKWKTPTPRRSSSFELLGFRLHQFVEPFPPHSTAVESTFGKPHYGPIRYRHGSERLTIAFDLELHIAAAELSCR